MRPSLSGSVAVIGLQRGRTCLSAEIHAEPNAPAAADGASTGPHLFECGDLLSLDEAQQTLAKASTGPHLFECGDLIMKAAGLGFG